MTTDEAEPMTDEAAALEHDVSILRQIEAKLRVVAAIYEGDKQTRDTLIPEVERMIERLTNHSTTPEVEREGLSMNSGVFSVAWRLCDDTEGTIHEDEFGAHYRVTKENWDDLAAAVADFRRSIVNVSVRQAYLAGLEDRRSWHNDAERRELDSDIYAATHEPEYTQPVSRDAGVLVDALKDIDARAHLHMTTDPADWCDLLHRLCQSALAAYSRRSDGATAPTLQPEANARDYAARLDIEYRKALYARTGHVVPPESSDVAMYEAIARLAAAPPPAPEVGEGSAVWKRDGHTSWVRR